MQRALERDRYHARLSRKTWELLYAAALNFRDVYFTIEDLAAALETDDADVRNRLRTLGRAKVIKEEYDEGRVELPSDARQWEKQWDGRRYLCHP